MKNLFGIAVSVEELLTICGEATGTKQPMTSKFRIGGSSANAALAMKHLGGSPTLLALIGPPKDYYTSILHDLTERAGIRDRHYIEALKKTNNAKVIITPGKSHSPVIGERGHLKSDISQVAKMFETFSNGGFTVVTSVREEEALLAKILLKNTQEDRRFLHIHHTFCGHDSLCDLASYADIMVMNEDEFQKTGGSVERLHAMGPRAIVVTQAEKGGYCSFEGNRFAYDPVRKYSGSFSSDVGAGDYFNGALVHAISSCDWNVSDLRDREKFGQVIDVAADAAAQKVAFGKILHRHV